MERTVIATKQAPAAIGPYSQGIAGNGFVFTAGQIALDPATQDLVSGGITEQTERVMENLKAILARAGATMDRAVKTTVFLQSMDDFAAMNAVYSRYFPANPPARSTVEVSRLPRNALVEIEVIALV
ncbi:MAG: RidA family protein [Chloroflexi bacterium]|nr:RidA family protein [Chloroflexota bacterium]